MTHFVFLMCVTMRAVKNPEFYFLNYDYETKCINMIKPKYLLHPRHEMVGFELPIIPSYCSSDEQLYSFNIELETSLTFSFTCFCSTFTFQKNFI